jgi:CheY-like chemotaxis protein
MDRVLTQGPARIPGSSAPSYGPEDVVAKVVVIDDSKIMRRILSQFLEHGGHEAVVWEPMSAMEIMEKTTEVKPDLLVSDFQMPGCNGATVARMARKANGKLPIIVLTALRDAETMELLRKSQVNQILNKPISEPDFLKAVEAVLAGVVKG